MSTPVARIGLLWAGMTLANLVCALAGWGLLKRFATKAIAPFKKVVGACVKAPAVKQDTSSGCVDSTAAARRDKEALPHAGPVPALSRLHSHLQPCGAAPVCTVLRVLCRSRSCRLRGRQVPGPDDARLTAAGAQRMSYACQPLLPPHAGRQVSGHQPGPGSGPACGL
jgi:hypothetical protein